MPGRHTTAAVMGRALAVLAVLLGLLLLQGSLCDGTTGVGAPCVASCDDPLETPTVDADTGVTAAVFVAPDPVGGERDGGLVSLCVTVLLAILAMLAVLSWPGGLLTPPRPTRSAAPSARPATPRLPQLCALRL